jgi:hypothetical protein
MASLGGVAQRGLDDGRVMFDGYTARGLYLASWWR